MYYHIKESVKKGSIVIETAFFDGKNIEKCYLFTGIHVPFSSVTDIPSVPGRKEIGNKDHFRQPGSRKAQAAVRRRTGQ